MSGVYKDTVIDIEREIYRPDDDRVVSSPNKNPKPNRTCRIYCPDEDRILFIPYENPKPKRTCLWRSILTGVNLFVFLAITVASIGCISYLLACVVPDVTTFKKLTGIECLPEVKHQLHLGLVYLLVYQCFTLGVGMSFWGVPNYWYHVTVLWMVLGLGLGQAGYKLALASMFYIQVDLPLQYFGFVESRPLWLDFNEAWVEVYCLFICELAFQWLTLFLTHRRTYARP